METTVYDAFFRHCFQNLLFSPIHIRNGALSNRCVLKGSTPLSSAFWVVFIRTRRISVIGASVVNLYKKGQVYFDVVAPPISSGILKPCLSISLATWIISSSDGVISPDKPMMSAFSAMAVCRIFSHGVITPKSITLQTKWQKRTVNKYLRHL